MRQVGVGTVEPVLRRPPRAGIEVNDLAGRMHSGIGSPGAEQLHRVVGDPGKGLLDLLLNALHAGLLALPAAIGRPAVFNTGGNP